MKICFKLIASSVFVTVFAATANTTSDVVPTSTSPNLKTASPAINAATITPMTATAAPQATTNHINTPATTPIVTPTPIQSGSATSGYYDTVTNYDDILDLGIPIDYSQHGKNWSPGCQFGNRQSPINLDLTKTTPSNKISFEKQNYQDFPNAILKLLNNGTVISVFGNNTIDSLLQVYNQNQEDQLYQLSHMTWKTPSEHTINNRQYSAELQIFHTQPNNDRSVALSILFDDELADILGKRAKTCFVDAFDFDLYSAGIIGSIEIPVKEFIDYVPDNQMVYYLGSHTEPDCDENVTWIVNTQPHVITPYQVQSLKSLLSKDVQNAGGNYRNIQVFEHGKVYSFDNSANLALRAANLAAELAILAQTSSFARAKLISSVLISLVALALF